MSRAVIDGAGGKAGVEMAGVHRDDVKQAGAGGDVAGKGVTGQNGDAGLRRAWRIDRFGAQHLTCVEEPMPQPGPGEILVRVQAVSLNHRDLLLLDDRYGWTPPLPFTPGSDMAGTVVATGPGVTRFAAGDAVLGAFFAGWIDGPWPTEDAMQLGGPGPGMLATHVVLHEQWAVRAPASLTPVQACTLPCAALTAWYGLVEECGLRAGQTVLVHGTGGVALFGLQFARMHGARAIVVTGSPDKRADALALGASAVLMRASDWPAEVKRLTDGRGADHVLEIAGGANLSRSLDALAPNGTVSIIGLLDGGAAEGLAMQAVRTRATIRGIRIGHRRALEDLLRAVELNRLQPVIAGEHTFDDVPRAFEQLHGGPFGKVVVTFPGPNPG
jgi:alcohol dehydrogenase